jgi:protein-S-isoprenylcysteine O-methyltransferase Ste14
MTAHALNLVAVISLVACWAAFLVTWLATAIFFQSRAPAERKSSWYSSLQIGTVIVVIVGAAVPRHDWRALNAHVTSLRLVGLAVLVVATALTVWARLALGAMWSAAPAVKEDHQLRTSGPYAITRHPIYTGMLGMLLGSALLAGGRWLVAFPVFLVLLEIKIILEERLMLAEFPEDYPRYRQRVPQLIPGLRLLPAPRVTGRNAEESAGQRAPSVH